MGGDSHINQGTTVADDFLGVWGMWGRNNEVRVAATLRQVILMAFRSKGLEHENTKHRFAKALSFLFIRELY